MAPNCTKEVCLTIACGGYCLPENKIVSIFSHTFSARYTNGIVEAQEINTGISTDAGFLTVTAISLSCKVKR